MDKMNIIMTLLINDELSGFSELFRKCSQNSSEILRFEESYYAKYYSQKLVQIQPRTSPLKFDHLVEKFGVRYGIVSFNLASNADAW